MNQAQYSRLFSFLFNIANDVLVQAFEKGDYKKITLPFIVLRRLDLLLEPTKETVLNFSQAEEFKMMPEESQEQQLCQLTGYPFYNTSAFTMKMLRSETDTRACVRTSRPIWTDSVRMCRTSSASSTCVIM